jgi:hypothetical protein
MYRLTLILRNGLLFCIFNRRLRGLAQMKNICVLVCVTNDQNLRTPRKKHSWFLLWRSSRSFVAKLVLHNGRKRTRRSEKKESLLRRAEKMDVIGG